MAPLPRSDHLGQNGAHAEERPAQVLVDLGEPDFVRKVDEAGARPAAGAVDQDVEPAVESV